MIPDYVRKIARKFDNEQEIEVLSERWHNTLYVTPRIVIKVSTRDLPIFGNKRFSREKYFLDKISESCPEIPIPRVLGIEEMGDSSPRYIVTQRMLGLPYSLLRRKLNTSQRENVYSQLGVFLSRIHSVFLDGFGFIETPLQRGTWREHLLERTLNFLEINRDLFKEEDSRVFKRALEDLSQTKQSRLLHNDYHASNWLVNPETFEITAILDGELAYAGTPGYDVARAIIYEEDSLFEKAFIEGYGGDKISSIDLFSNIIVTGLELLAFFRRDERRVNAFRERILRRI